MKSSCLNCDNEKWTKDWFSPDFCSFECSIQYERKRKDLRAKGIKWTPMAREKYF